MNDGDSHHSVVVKARCYDGAKVDHHPAWNNFGLRQGYELITDLDEKD